MPGEPCQIASPIVEDNIPLFIECLVPGTPVLQHYSTFLANSFPGYRRLYELTVDLKQNEGEHPTETCEVSMVLRVCNRKKFLVQTPLCGEKEHGNLDEMLVGDRVCTQVPGSSWNFPVGA